MFRLGVCLLIGFLSLVPFAASQQVTVVQTTPDLQQTMQAQPNVSFSSSAAAPLTIKIDDKTKFQQIDGFGASITDSSAWLLFTKLSEAQRDDAMKQLFDPADGIGLSFIRQPIGASDLSLNHYSFDEMSKGETDPDLQHFSIAHDEAYILPVLRQALAINPKLKVMATPWSPPGWMKTSGSMVGGTLLPSARGAFADYFVKFIRAYESAGVPIYAITVQNEALYVPKDYPGMIMEADEQTKFLRDHLAPAFDKAGLRTKVMVYDHNWDRPDYPTAVLSDPVVNKFVAGTAFHCYGGKVEAQSKVHKRFPNKDIWETECSGGTWQTGSLLQEQAKLIIGSTRNWAKSVVLWNMALDQKNGPNAGGCDTCRGVVTVDHSTAPAKVIKTVDYFALGHASKYVLPGAYRIASNTFSKEGLENVAFQNPDGSVVLMALNNSSAPLSFSVNWSDKSFSYSLPAGAVATFRWSAVVNEAAQRAQ